MRATRFRWSAVLALSLTGWLCACSDSSDGPGIREDDFDNDHVPDDRDCAPRSGQSWRTLMGFRDTDGDGVGEGELTGVCSANSLPKGWVETGGDCAPGDATRWRLVEGLYPDADGDGATVQGPVTACVGTALTGYQPLPGIEDCNDHDASVRRTLVAWLDVDGDGVGAGPPVPYCEGGGPPPGHIWTDGDCAPEDGTRSVLKGYAFRDLDGDGITVAEAGTVCSPPSGLPPGYRPTPSLGEQDCDDASAGTWRLANVYADTDLDGYGAGAATQACVGKTPITGQSFEAEDCAPDDATVWQWLSYNHRDTDGDGHTAPSPGVLCGGAGLPVGYSVSPSGDDCDDRDATVQVSWSVFPDEDGDGTGAGTQVTLCASTTLPQGYSSRPTDCAPTDATRWQVLAYAHRDADGDGFTVPLIGELCSGASLPEGYATTAQGADCDDTQATLHTTLTAWNDVDGDGVGSGEAFMLCTNGQVPSPYSPVGSDCAAEDATRWRTHAYSHVDRDADGATTPETGTVCAQETLPAVYSTRASGNDCDDADATRTHWAVLYPDQDGDGVGTEPRTIPCIGATLPPGYSHRGDDSDDADPTETEDPDDALVLELLIGS
ncbi:hypothetical protein LY474_38130 [Myxococcus stipitatus]|uniref:hypothetical protein n=1 Tax=Myxococcus stipitatus TaxID=83455 RepID=UPI001F16885F|nr:hypothetical protein [Myxococcus stipitatus]MCE9673639.1 hypothetical protein [Myxococcus stipitatus]